jgi:hypothetical protein
MQLTYDILNNITMTIQQCNNEYEPLFGFIMICWVISVIILAFFVFCYMNKYIKMSKFIESEKLCKKYQEYKKDTKGM